MPFKLGLRGSRAAGLGMSVSIISFGSRSTRRDDEPLRAEVGWPGLPYGEGRTEEEVRLTALMEGGGYNIRSRTIWLEKSFTLSSLL